MAIIGFFYEAIGHFLSIFKAIKKGKIQITGNHNLSLFNLFSIQTTTNNNYTNESFLKIK